MAYYEWVKKNTCGSCTRFQYYGNKEKGFCERYGSYYWPDSYNENCWDGDKDMYDEEKRRVMDKDEKAPDSLSSGSSGCYLTTACCEYLGLSDDCPELEALRHFRDGYLKNYPHGQEIIDLYYRDAPGIVERINRLDNKKEIYLSVYERIKEILQLLSEDKSKDAIIVYMLMTYELSVLAK